MCGEIVLRKKKGNSMPVFKINDKRSGYKLIGAMMPPWVHIYMTLYSLAKGTTKSKIITKLLEEWMEQEPEYAILIEKLVNRLVLKWNAIKSSKLDITFTEYIKDVERELIAKGIPENDVKTIIKKTEQYEKNKKTRTT